MTWLFLVQLAATIVMVGVIWFVQIVHYPLFASIPAERFPDYEAAHQRLTTYIVAPAMLVEAATAAAWLAWTPVGVPAAYAWLGAGLVAVVWLSTYFLQVPLHRKLAERFDPATIRSLVASNWLRTVAWTARGVLLLVVTASLLR